MNTRLSTISLHLISCAAIGLSTTGCETPRLSSSTQAVADSAPMAQRPRFLMNAMGPEAHVRYRLPIGTPVNQARLILSDDGLSTTAQFADGGVEIRSLVASYTDKTDPKMSVTHVFNIAVQNGAVAGMTYGARTGQL